MKIKIKLSENTLNRIVKNEIKKLLSEGYFGSDYNLFGRDTIHTVQRGENLTLIAQKYETTVDAIRRANDLSSDTIRPGQELKIMWDVTTQTGPAYVDGESQHALARLYRWWQGEEGGTEPEQVVPPPSGEVDKSGRTTADKNLSGGGRQSLLFCEMSGCRRAAISLPHGGRIYSTGARQGTDHTIGYGHALTTAEKTAAGLATAGRDRNGDPMWAEVHGVKITYHRDWGGITEQQATHIFAQDLSGDYEDRVNRHGLSLKQHEFDALVHFAYNVGRVPSSIVSLVNSGQYDDVPDKMREYAFSGGQRLRGLTTRREVEANMWNGVYL